MEMVPRSSEQKSNSSTVGYIHGDTQHIAKMFNWILCLIAITLVIGILITGTNGDIYPLRILSISLPILLIPYYMVRKQAFELAAVFISITFLTIITLVSTLGLGIHHIATIAYPTIIIVAGLVTQKRTLTFILLYNIACVAWLVFGELTNAFTPLPLIRSVPGDFFSVSVVLILAALLVRLVTKTLFQSQYQLQKEFQQRNLVEEKYRTIFENSIDGIFQSTPQGRLLSVNPAMARMYGYNSPEEMLSEVTDIGAQIYINPEMRNVIRRRIESGEQIKGYEALEYRKDRSTIWTSMNAQVIRDSNGNVLYYEGTVEDITPRKTEEIERKRAEKSLLQFRKLMDQSNDSIFVIDQQTGRYIDFNKKAHEQLGYSREELLEISIIDIAKHIPTTRVWHERVALVHEKDGLIFETNYKRKDGSSFAVEVSARILEYNDEPVVLAFVRDITERKRTEEFFQESQKRLQAFFNQSLDGFFFTIFKAPRTWDDSINKDEVLHEIFTTERFSEVNDAMLEQYGMTREKFLAQTSSDVFAHDPQQGLQLRRQLFDNGHLHIETFEKRNNGSTAWFEGEYVCLYDEEKRISGFFGIQRDITLRKQNEMEHVRLLSDLAIKNEESETLRESLASIIDTVEFSEIIQRILDQIKRVIPYDSASVWKVEGNYQKVIAGRGLPEGVKTTYVLDETNSATPLLHGDVAYVLSNNVQDELPDFKEPPDNIINSWLAIPLKTRGNIIGFIALDGYQQEQFQDRHINLALNFANQVAIALENSRLFSNLQNELALRKDLISELETKNIELERFTYTVSHDLKSPLVTINGFLGYLEADIASGNMERVRRDRERIQGAVNKMYLLLNDLLELSRIGRLMNKPEVVKFEDLVNDALQIVQGRLEANRVTVHTQPNLPAIYGDRQRLTEVLQNLFDNAAKFMGDQTDPRIEVGQDGEENGRPIFYVRDNGIGIAAEYHDQVFGLFNKLQAGGEGTGIGLAIVKRIIEVHGGRIWVESEAGRGATFCFTLQTSEENIRNSD
jgi:PAS domain S-box-containing protein